jgi:Flp pilus assembly protein TadD
MISPDALNQMGLDLAQRGDLEGARLHYLAALKTSPDFWPAVANLAVVLSHQNKLASAAVLIRRLLNVVPDDPNQLNNLGNMLMRLERYEESREVLERATMIAPDNLATWYNLALLSLRDGRDAEALSHMDKVDALGGSSHQLRNDRAHALLAIGTDLAAALELYEARWESMAHLPPWDFHIPEWKGEALHGKSILLHAEQGYGDSIMTSRFARDLANCGAQVTLCLPGDLCSLFSAQDWPNVRVLSMDDLNPDVAKEFDFHSPMMSAMRWLGVEQADINSAPYLRVPEIVGPRLRTLSAFNVGICWASGSRGNEYDWRRRIAPLEHWLPLAELPDIQLHSLQVGPDASDIERLGAEALVLPPAVPFANWADTAAFMAQLDLVISVDTAIVHLAGALGKPCWMLSQFNHCWRWWGIDLESGRPWYDSVRIIRQAFPGDWKRQLKQVYERLRMRDGALRMAAE